MKKFLYIFYIPVLIILLASCETVEPDPTPSRTEDTKLNFPLEQADRTLLIYAVASNNLYNDYLNDCQEILQGAQRLSNPDETIRIVMYSVVPKMETASLSIVFKNQDAYEFKQIKEYDRDIFSTDPRRISAVIDDVRHLCPADNYGIIFWSHASGWTPFFSQRELTYSNSKKRAYGTDQDLAGNTDQCDIIELTDALPDGVFDFVWFDCCYMGSVEVAYELSRKIPSMVAYPSEIVAEGLPYDLIIPLIAKKEPDFIGAVTKMSSYFKSKNLPYSIGYYDLTSPEMGKIKRLFKELDADNPNPDQLWNVQKYSRSPYGPFYDLRAYLRQSVKTGTSDINARKLTEFEEALDKFVLYKNCSSKAFTSLDWILEDCSGLSVWQPISGTDYQKDYYLQLVWGKP